MTPPHVSGRTLSKKASSPKLQKAFTDHLKQTEGHIERLQQIGELLQIKLTGKKCHAMEGLVEEGDSWFQHTVLDDRLFGVAGHVDDLQLRASFGEPSRQIGPACARHYDVCQEHVHGRIPIGDFEGLCQFK